MPPLLHLCQRSPWLFFRNDLPNCPEPHAVITHGLFPRSTAVRRRVVLYAARVSIAGSLGFSNGGHILVMLWQDCCAVPRNVARFRDSPSACVSWLHSIWTELLLHFQLLWRPSRQVRHLHWATQNRHCSCLLRLAIKRRSVQLHYAPVCYRLL